MKKFQYLFPFTVVLFLSIGSVAESAGPVTAGSCNNRAGGFCNEFTGPSYKAANVEKSCTKQKMAFLAGACPAEGRVGSCIVYKGRNDESSYRYYGSFPGYGVKPKAGVVAEAEKQCSMLKGAWSPN